MFCKNSMLFFLLTPLMAFSQILTTGEYFIQVNKTQKYLAIENISTANGAKLVQWDFANQRNHRFLVTHLGNDTYSIQAMHSGKYIGTEGDAVRGAKIIQSDWQNQDNQKWLIVKFAAGWQITCLRNRRHLYLTGLDAVTFTPGNGAYFIINEDAPPMHFNFKKNELEPADILKNKRLQSVQ